MRSFVTCTYLSTLSPLFITYLTHFLKLSQKNFVQLDPDSSFHLNQTHVHKSISSILGKGEVAWHQVRTACRIVYESENYLCLFSD